MADYTFYTGAYLGSLIPETAFDGLASQARQYLNKWKRRYQVESVGPEAENMAICAMAETLWSYRKAGLASASVGNVSVRYDTDRKALARELYEKASVYLDIYRGVG